VDLEAVDDQRVDLLREEVAHDPLDELGLAVDHGGRAGAGRALLDLLPGAEERLELALEGLARELLADGANDDAARALRQDLAGEGAQPRPLLAVLDLARHPDVVGLRHVDEEAPGQGDVRGDPRPLGADRLLGDLHQDVLPLLDQVLDGREAARAAAPRTALVRRGVVVLVVVLLLATSETCRKAAFSVPMSTNAAWIPGSTASTLPR
jgi:hypothetical protein